MPLNYLLISFFVLFSVQLNEEDYVGDYYYEDNKTICLKINADYTGISYFKNTTLFTKGPFKWSVQKDKTWGIQLLFKNGTIQNVFLAKDIPFKHTWRKYLLPHWS